MLSSGGGNGNLIRGNGLISTTTGTTTTATATASSSSSDMPPPLPQCLPLDQISLGNQRYPRFGELRRVLGVSQGSASAAEDYSFGLAHSKHSPPVATEELKHFRESVQDASRKARDRAKLLGESLSKLEKYRFALNSSKKRQRNEILLNERSNAAKMGNQIHRHPHEGMTQRLQDRSKSLGLNKRARTSVADVRGDGRSTAALRQQMVMEKGGDMLQDVGEVTARFEEKICKLPAGGEGWDTKNKKKRSVGLVGGRIINGDQDLKRATHPKMNADSKLRMSDSQGFRSKSSPSVGGINKLDGSMEPIISDTATVPRHEMQTGHSARERMALLEQRSMTKGNNKPSVNEDNLGSNPNTVIKAKVSRAPRTGSIMQLDSSLKVHSSSTPLQGSSSHAMAQWVGQRPHKNARSRRTNIVAPISNNAEAQNSPQGYPNSDFGARASSIGNNGPLVCSSMENSSSKIKRELDSVPSPFGFSESEESGAGDFKMKDKGTDSSEVTLTANQKVGSLLLNTKKNRSPSSEIGDGVQTKGRSGRCSSLTRSVNQPVREKLENLPTTKPLQNLKPAPDKNKSKTGGRPPSKKLKERKGSARVSPKLHGGSLDLTGESDDDCEALILASNSARDASSLACSGPFWKKMESVFATINSEDISYLRKQISFADELHENLSQMLGVEYDVLGFLVHKESAKYPGERQGNNACVKQVKAAPSGAVDFGMLDRGAPLYQRVLSALIAEDESEEFCTQTEGKNTSLYYASDDSHCGSCNLIDVEPKDRDRIESEVESNVDFQPQKNCFLDRLSCNRSLNATRNSGVFSSLHSSEVWQGDDAFSQSEHANEICSNGFGHLSPSDRQYQLMSLEDKLLLELQSIGLCPEILPDLAEGEAINQDIMQLKEGLSQQIGRKRKKLRKIDQAIEKGKDVERRTIEQVAMDKLIEMAYRKRLACRWNNNSKSAVRKVSRQVALDFVKRTLARSQKFEDTGSSCFSEPDLQEIIFSTPPCNNDAKSADCGGSGTASNTCNEVSNPHADARGSATVSSTVERYASQSDNFERCKKREALIDDVIGSASSRVTSTIDGDVRGGVKAKRSSRDRDQKKDNLRNNPVCGAGHASSDGLKIERKTKLKPKQKSDQVSAPDNGPSEPSHPVANAGNNDRGGLASHASNPRVPDAVEADAAIGLGLDTLEENPDLDSWLNNIEEDGMQDLDSIGLEIPMDDLSQLNFM